MRGWERYRALSCPITRAGLGLIHRKPPMIDGPPVMLDRLSIGDGARRRLPADREPIEHVQEFRRPSLSGVSWIMLTD